MDALLEERINCPYCGEPMTVLVDTSESGQSYTEDCQICCRPMILSVSMRPITDLSCDDVTIDVRTEND